MLSIFFRKILNQIQNNFFHRPCLKYASTSPNNFYQIFLQRILFYDSVDESFGVKYFVSDRWDRGNVLTRFGEHVYCSSGLGAWTPLDIVFSYFCWCKYAKEVKVTYFITLKFSDKKLWSSSLRNMKLSRNQRNEKQIFFSSMKAHQSNTLSPFK